MEQIDVNVLDINELSKLRKSVIVTWLQKNLKAVNACTASCLIDLLQNGVKIPELLTSLPAYCSDTEFKNAILALGKKSSTAQMIRPLPAIVSFATRYEGVSCHSIMFRKNYPTYIGQKEHAFLSLMLRLPAAHRERICKYLESEKQDPSNLLFILKQRILALSAERDVSLDEMLTFSTLSNMTKKVIREFYYDKTTPESGASKHYLIEHNKDALSGVPMVSVVYLICILYKVSADRLLIQDYSGFALLPDGSALTPYQRYLLSLYLSASPFAQEKAFQEITLSLAAIPPINKYNGSAQ